jgi:hypothetical protein
MNLILPCIVCWQAWEISWVLSQCDPGHKWNRSLPAGMRRPIEWDNVVLYGQYILDRKLVRRCRPPWWRARDLGQARVRLRFYGLTSFDQIDQLTLLQLIGGDKGSRSQARRISLQLTETRTEWPLANKTPPSRQKPFNAVCFDGLFMCNPL